MANKTFSLLSLQAAEKCVFSTFRNISLNQQITTQFDTVDDEIKGISLLLSLLPFSSVFYEYMLPNWKPKIYLSSIITVSLLNGNGRIFFEQVANISCSSGQKYHYLCDHKNLTLNSLLIVQNIVKSFFSTSNGITDDNFSQPSSNVDTETGLALFAV